VKRCIAHSGNNASAVCDNLHLPLGTVILTLRNVTAEVLIFMNFPYKRILLTPTAGRPGTSSAILQDRLILDILKGLSLEHKQYLIPDYG
jgi:hypothetical protein